MPTAADLRPAGLPSAIPAPRGAAPRVRRRGRSVPGLSAAIVLAALLVGGPVLAQAEAARAAPAAAPPGPASPAPVALRVATFNLGDVRTEDTRDPRQPRLRRLAEVIQRIRPNVILLNEIAYDRPGAPGHAEGEPEGQNARRFVENFLAHPQAEGLEPIRYRAFMVPTNTGMPSGFDLDRDGQTVTAFPPPAPSRPDGSPGRQTAEARAYGNDAWGFGTFPGQYGMAILVDERLEVLEHESRTFRLFPWAGLPNAVMPVIEPSAEDGPPAAGQRSPETRPDPAVSLADPAADGGDEESDAFPAQPEEAEPSAPEPWYAGEAGELFRLSSKNHWDLPVRLPNGTVLHLLASHPTPPAFDGPEARNKRRNHDEIRFWADYVDGAAYPTDDAGRPGGLRPGSRFIILGDLNADPDEGDSFENPVGRFLFRSRWINASFTPASDLPVDGLDPDDTARFGLRVDYVLPSVGLEVLRGGVWRHPPAGSAEFPSDHYPVWIDVAVPPPAAPRRPLLP